MPRHSYGIEGGEREAVGLDDDAIRYAFSPSLKIARLTPAVLQIASDEQEPDPSTTSAPLDVQGCAALTTALILRSSGCVRTSRRRSKVETCLFLSTRQAAQSLGVHPQTLRRWEREGIVPTPTRRRGQRIYTEGDLELIRARVMCAGANKEDLVR